LSAAACGPALIKAGEAVADATLPVIRKMAPSHGDGRPSLSPGIYFRLLLLGYFEGIDSERGIASVFTPLSGLQRHAEAPFTGLIVFAAKSAPHGP
jgi:hypothetical protein